MINESIEIITLLGSRNLPFSTFCLQSLLQCCSNKLTLIIFEDGSLRDDEKKYLKHHLPESRIINKIERDCRIKQIEHRFPNCVKFRNENVLGQKLIDLLVLNKPILFIDSDMLFLKNFSLPLFRLPTFIKDAQNAYIFHPLKKIIEFPIFPKINTGFFYFPFVENALILVEEFLNDKQLYLETKRLPMWAEQSLWALLAGTFSSIEYFNEREIAIATSKHTSDIPIGIHLVSAFRGRFDYYKQFCSLPKIKPITLMLKLTTKKLSLTQYRYERICKRLDRMF